MKIRFVVLLPLLLASTLLAETNAPTVSPLLAKLDMHYGFRDLKFEQSVDSISGLTLLEEDGDFKFYNRKSDKLEIDKAHLKSIEYDFYKGRLASVLITSTETPNGVALLQAYEDQYGPARKSPRNPKKLYWFGNRVMGDCMINDKGEASISLWSKPMQEVRGADVKAAKVKAGQ